LAVDFRYVNAAVTVWRRYREGSKYF
jgi:hypothetical protein